MEKRIGTCLRRAGDGDRVERIQRGGRQIMKRVIVGVGLTCAVALLPASAVWASPP